MFMPDNFEKIKKETKEISGEVKEKTVGYIATALGLVAGLAWNEAIKSLIDYFYPAGGNSFWLKFLYAIVITVAIVIATVYLLKLTRRKE